MMGELFSQNGRVLAQDIAAPSPEPEGSDLVEEYSFNTGTQFAVCIIETPTFIYGPAFLAAENQAYAKDAVHEDRRCMKFRRALSRIT